VVAEVAHDDLDTFCLERRDVLGGICEDCGVVRVVVVVDIARCVAADVGCKENDVRKERSAVRQVLTKICLMKKQILFAACTLFAASALLMTSCQQAEEPIANDRE